MIPDKIYTDNRGAYAELPIFSQADANVEYISKDALIEILQGYSHPLTKLVMREIIDKINSL